MADFRDLMKKKHVKNHPLFKNSQRVISHQRRTLTKHAQELAGDNSSTGGVDTDDIFNEMPEESEANDKKLSSLVLRAVRATEDIFTQLDFPLPPKVSYNRTRNVKYSNVNEYDVVSGIVLLNCKISTINNMTKQLEVPVSIVRGQVIPPSVFLYEGRMPIIAQSTIDEIVQRVTSYELPPIRQMFSPPMNREEREMFTSMRNELGWKPRDMGGLSPNRYRSGRRKATYTPGKTPAAYEAVVEKMQEAQEAGEDTFPRAWHYILRNYILQTINTADKDAWEVHLINDGWAINPWQRGRKRGQVEGPNQILNFTNEIKAWASENGIKVYGQPILDSQYTIKWKTDPTVDLYSLYEDWVEGHYLNGEVEVAHLRFNEDGKIEEMESDTISREASRRGQLLGDKNRLNDLYDMFEDFKNTMSVEDEVALGDQFNDAEYSIDEGNTFEADNILDDIKQKLDEAMSQDYKSAQMEDFDEDLGEDFDEGLDEEEVAEVVEEVVQKMYNGTKMPMEISDSAKFNTKGGPIRGKIVEINADDDYIIIASKGIEYRVHCEDIEPLNSTYKNKFSRKKVRRSKVETSADRALLELKDQSISHGTMIDTDIVEAIDSALEGILAHNHPLWSYIKDFWDAEEDSEERSMILNESIWDAMNDIAPEGTSFGSHPGDGSDYGFWSYSEFDDDDDDDDDDEDYEESL